MRIALFTVLMGCVGPEPTPTEEPALTAEPPVPTPLVTPPVTEEPVLPTLPDALVEGISLSGEAVASFAGGTTDQVGLKGELIYAAVVNQTGSAHYRFQAGVVLLDAQDQVTLDVQTRCYAAQGGDTVVAGATAHCVWNNPDGAVGVFAEVGFVDGEIPEDPAGEARVQGAPVIGGQGTRFGWIESQICRVAGAGSTVGSPTAISLDGQGRPWDFAIGPVYSTYDGECVDVLVGGLHLPADPVVILYPG
jgi:hypothetical protein